MRRTRINLLRSTFLLILAPSQIFSVTSYFAEPFIISHLEIQSPRCLFLKLQILTEVVFEFLSLRCEIFQYFD